MQLKALEQKIEAEFKKLEEKLHDLFDHKSNADISSLVADAKTATQQVAVDHVQEQVADATTTDADSNVATDTTQG
jgi:hypothetical protein